MKKTLALLFALLMLLTCACGNTPAPEQSEAAAGPEINVVSGEPAVTETAVPEPSVVPEAPSPEPVAEPEEGEPNEDNPVMNFVGPYSVGGCNVFIEAFGSETAHASVTWYFGSSILCEWSMSGRFDPDSLSFNYSDCVKTNYTLDDDGFPSESETVYEDGTGNIAFTGEGALYWTDEIEHIADGMIFAFSGGRVEDWGNS